MAMALTAWALAAACAALAPRGDSAAAPILAESALFRDRLAAPQRHFLLDGSQGFVAGEAFYQARGGETPFLWPADPFLRYAPDTAWMAGTSRADAELGLGNEIGDSMLQGLADAEADRDNRTPWTAARIAWSPRPAWRAHAGFDQNDHSSYRTSPARMRLVGEEQRDDMAWFGGNIPPKSLADAGLAYRSGNVRGALRYARGWWWTASPVSGAVHPWEGGRAEAEAGLGRWGLSVRDEAWESRVRGGGPMGRWRRSLFEASAGGQAPSGIAWRASAGAERRDLAADAYLAGFESVTPLASLALRTRDGGASRLAWNGAARWQEDLLSLEQTLTAREGSAARSLSQSFQAYYRRRLPGYRFPVEHPLGDSAGEAAYRPGRDARGASAEGRIRVAGERAAAGAEAIGAAEWQLPRFRAAGIDTVAGVLVRTGALEASRHVLWNGSLRAYAEDAGGAPGRWRIEAGCRGFAGDDARAMEFRPSRWWAGADAGWTLPSDLSARVALRVMGAKEVRGWGTIFRVPAHFENAIGLDQDLPGGHARLRFALLHAFGRDLREQPNGSPLRFRVLGGAEAFF
jgi:hypothetical protein